MPRDKRTLRKIEILVDPDAENGLVEANLDDLEIGDLFRITEPDGTVVRNQYGGVLWEVRQRPSVDAIPLDPQGRRRVVEPRL